MLCPSGKFEALPQWFGGDGILCWLRLRRELAGDMFGYTGRAGLGGGFMESGSSTEPLEPEMDGTNSFQHSDILEQIHTNCVFFNHYISSNTVKQTQPVNLSIFLAVIASNIPYSAIL